MNREVANVADFTGLMPGPIHEQRRELLREKSPALANLADALDAGTETPGAFGGVGMMRPTNFKGMSARGNSVSDTFKGGNSKDITLKKGTILERAFEEGKTDPVGAFTTRGNTAKKVTTPQSASDVLALKGTSDALPTHVSTLQVKKTTTAKIGFIKGSSEKRATQIVVDKPKQSLVEVERRALGDK